jgi:cytochrome c2
VAHRRLIQGRYSHFALPGSPVTERGRRHLQTAGCRRCHLIGGKGNRLASDLDLVARDATPGELHAAIRQPALLMPDFQFPETKIVELVNALLEASRKNASGPAEEIPRVIYFAGQENKEENAFSRYCGDCHRLLSPVLGGVGKGTIAPNLSGLLTEFYPRFFRGEERWSGENLKKWLKNPRSIRPGARMPPVHPEQKELLELWRSWRLTPRR